MFATIEEAEKAAAMLRRFGGIASRPRQDMGGRWYIDPGPGEMNIWGWEQVADFLLDQPYPPLSEDDE